MMELSEGVHILQAGPYLLEQEEVCSCVVLIWFRSASRMHSSWCASQDCK
jgi:hypothetical protein